MESNFEELINSYLENNVGISEHFLSNDLVQKLKLNLLKLNDEKLLSAAGIGKTENLIHDSKIRSDSIFWLDRSHQNDTENSFLDLMDEFIKYLNISCYTGITNSEFHYSLYEKGSFYNQHLDQFNNNSNRQYSMISYLNENWEENDGGQLLVQHEKSSQKINPTDGKMVFFKSDELLHEVLVTQKRRMSVTGWLKNN